MQCLSCKYDLRELHEHRCPECGREFDPRDPNSFYDPESTKEKRKRAELLVFVAIVLYLLMSAVLNVGQYFERNEAGKVWLWLWAAILAAALAILGIVGYVRDRCD